jgi:hypothetical protein
MMSTLDLFKYLDPTTSDDSSFLSFSSFADLTQPRYQQDDYSLPSSSFGQVFDYSQESGNTKPNFTSSPTPPFTCSDVGSEFDYPQDPFSIITNAFSPLISSPNNGEFGIFHTPSKAGPLKLSGPSHQSHRSTSSSSDWNSPVTPSLTYKSSVDSLATLAPENDFYLPPSSHLPSPGYGWDDQAFGASSSTSAHNSPPSPSPYRVVSNPSLGTRHPRVIKQIMSMPALKEEEQSQSASWFDEFLHNDDAKVEDKLAEDLDWTLNFPEFNQGNNQTSTDGTIFQAFTEQDSNDVSNLSFDNAQPSSSTIPTYQQVEAPAIVPDLSFSSVDDNDVNHFYQWMNENPVDMSGTNMDMTAPGLDMSNSTLDMSSASTSAPSSSWGQYPAQNGIAPSAVFQNDLRPSTAPDALGWSDNSLSVPGPGSMMRR